MTNNHRLTLFGGMLLSAVGLILMLAGTGCVSAAQTTHDQQLATALDKQTAAVQAYIAWDKQHELDLVHGSKTQEEAAAKLKEYRATRAKTLQLLQEAGETLAAALQELAPVPAPPALPDGGGAP